MQTKTKSSDLKKDKKRKVKLEFDKRCALVAATALQEALNANITPSNSLNYIDSKFGQIIDLYRQMEVEVTKNIMLTIFEDFKIQLEKANNELKSQVKEIIEADTGKGKKFEELDLTEKRNRKCAPVIERLVEEVFYKKLLTFDREYFEERVDEVLAYFYKGYPIDAYNEIMRLISLSINDSFKKANAIKWGKDDDEIGMEDLEETLNPNFKKGE